MSDKDAAPTAGEVDTIIIDQLLAIYPDVLASFYRDKVKGNDEKRKEAQEDDEWRYVQLPKEVEQRASKQGLSKAELERLVKWKITHQTNRPFLLPQVRKNESKIVEKCTLDARNILFQSSPLKSSEPRSLPLEHIRKALDKVCELNGVGPATGTLILSIFDGRAIPFFEDELYAWLLPNVQGKLKYNVKEYFEMIDKARELMLLDGKPKYESTLPATSLEKAAFVCQHWDHASEKDKKRIRHLRQSKVDKPAVKTQEDNKTSENASAGSRSKPTIFASLAKTTGKRKAENSEEQVTSRRRSQRMKK